MAKHYHYGAGLRGCLYQDGPHTAKSYDETVEALVESYSLTTRESLTLAHHGFLGLDLAKHGNEYCEISRACYCKD